MDKIEEPCRLRNVKSVGSVHGASPLFRLKRMKMTQLPNIRNSHVRSVLRRTSGTVYALPAPHVGSKSELLASSARRCLSNSLRTSVRISGMTRFTNCSFAAAFICLAVQPADRSTATYSGSGVSLRAQRLRLANLEASVGSWLWISKVPVCCATFYERPSHGWRDSR